MNFTTLHYLLLILDILLYIAIGVFVMLFTVSDSNHTLYCVLGSICGWNINLANSILSEISDDLIIIAILAIGLLAILLKGLEALLKYIRNKLHSNNDK